MAGYSRTDTTNNIADGNIINASDFDGEFDAIATAFGTSGHTHDGTTAEGGPITKLLGNSLTFGTGADTDIAITFDGNTSDGVLTWKEDEDYFEFSDDILIASTEKLQFRDTAIYINSSADGQLDLVADTEIQLAATTVDLNGNLDVSGSITLGGTAITSTAAELNILDGVTSTATELNALDGITSTVTELNILDGDTSASSVTVADADRVVLNDGGTMKQVAVTDLSAYFDDEITAMPNLVTTAATTVGALNSGSITSGFGTIDTGSSTITTTGLITGGSLDIDDVVINGTTIGHTDDTDLITLASGSVTIAGDLTVSGDDITMGTNTSGNLLIADGTNFNSVAVGSLSEISTVANDDVFLAVDTSGGGLKKIARSAVVSGLASSAAISNVVEDTTPQLGGDLDVNGNDLVSTSNGNISLLPNGTGKVIIDGNGSSGGVSITDGLIDIRTGTGNVTKVKFYCESSNAHAQTLQAAPHSASSSAVLVLPTASGTLVGTGDTGSVSNTMLAGSIADSKLSTISTADKVSGAAVQVDGATDGTSITLADSDKFLVDDGGTTKYINASQLNAYTSAAVALDDVSTGDAAVTLATSAGNITIDAQGNDTDIILKGTDGSSDTTFLTIDGSAAGEATFNAGIVIADAGNIGSASDKDAIAIASDGVVTFSQAPVFPDGSIAIDDLNIDGGTDIGADLVDADEIIVDDGGGGTNRRSDLTRVKKYVYSAMSGDATASDAGAVTVANDAIESGMLNDNVISGQTALTSGLATTDELLVSDGGTLKRMDVSLILNSAADEATALAIALG